MPPSPKRSSVRLLSALLALSCAGRVAPPAVPQVPAPEAPRWTAVIDAGSSGSRIHLYRWWPGDPVPRVEAVTELKVEPGLASFADDLSAVADHLEPLVEFARDVIGAPAALSESTIQLAATGGVRLLPDGERSAVLEAARAYLAASSFRVGAVEAIDGRREGIYGWIAVNYLLGYLDDGGPFPSAGALDLGGVSTQITFVPLDSPREEAVELLLAGRRWRLYSHSYLGLGQDEARKAVGSAACYPAGYPFAEGRTGAGDFDACRGEVLRLLAGPCVEPPCSAMGVYQPPLYGEFFAFSAFYYAASFFELGEVLDLGRLSEAGAAYCARPWSELEAAYLERLAWDSYVPRHCFTAAFLVSLLHEGYGFPLEGDSVRVPARLQGQEISWTLGAAVFDLAAGELR